MPPQDRFAFKGPAEIIAHRGFSGTAPENTLAAIEAAIRAGADGVEFDLRVTSDGTPVLFHDSTLRRTTDGDGAVDRATIDDLKKVDAGSWFGQEFRGEEIPTLTEALDLISDRLGRTYIELKGVGRLDNVDRIADVVSKSGSLERSVFIAMDWALLDRVRARQPTAAVGYIVRKKGELEGATAKAVGDPAALLDFDKRLLLGDSAIAQQMVELGIPMAAWTVDELSEADALLSMGVPRITTNQVGRLVEWRSALSGDPDR